MEVWSQLLGIKIETIATITVTICTFFLGFFINHLINVRVAYLKRDTTRRILKVNLNKLILQTEKQASGFDMIQQQLTIDNLELFSFIDYDIPSADIFNKIGYENSFIALFTGIENEGNPKENVVDGFNKMWNIIKHLNDIQATTKKKFEDFMKMYQEMEEKRNVIVGQIPPIVESAIIELVGQNVPELVGAYFDARQAITDEYLLIPNRTQPKPVNEYFQKLIELNRKHIDNIAPFEQNIKTLSLNAKINEASLRFDNLNNYFMSTQREYVYLRDDYLKNAKELETISKILFKLN